MIEYSQFTGDSSNVLTITQALVANYGPNNDILLPWKKNQEVFSSVSVYWIVDTDRDVVGE
jgi:hypothetical protein